MIFSFPFSLLLGADAVAAIGMADDYVAFCFAGAQGLDELAFNTGYVGVEDGF